MTTVAACLLPATQLALQPHKADATNVASAQGLAQALDTTAQLVAKQQPDTLIVLSDSSNADGSIQLLNGTELAVATPQGQLVARLDTALASALEDISSEDAQPDSCPPDSTGSLVDTTLPVPLDFNTEAFAGSSTATATALAALFEAGIHPQDTRVLRVAVAPNSPQKLWRAGALIGRLTSQLGRRVAWVVCGRLAAKNHVVAAQFATLVCDALRTGDYLPLMLANQGSAQAAEQNVLASLQLVLGALGPTAVESRLFARARLTRTPAPADKNQNLQSEYAVASIVPKAVWGSTPQRDYLSQWRVAQADLIRQARDAETEYSALARAACETWIAQGRSFMPPRTTSPLISGAHHGCEVRIYEFGALRGISRHACATEQNLAIEICVVAREAATQGALHSHIRCEELKYLTYEVQVLS